MPVRPADALSLPVSGTAGPRDDQSGAAPVGTADTAEAPKVVRDRLCAVAACFAAHGLFMRRGNMVDAGTTVSERRNRRVGILYTP